MSKILLKEAISAIKSGDINHGRDLLVKVLNENPRDENAWLWMIMTVKDAGQKKWCIENALAINPANEQAQKGMNKYQQVQAVSIAELVSISTLPQDEEFDASFDFEIDTEKPVVSKPKPLKKINVTKQTKVPKAPESSTKPQSIQTSFIDFWNSGITGKAVIGCGGLLILCCACFVPITMLQNVSSEPRTQRVVEQPAIETPKLELPPAHSLPTDTPIPTATITPTPIPTSTPLPIGLGRNNPFPRSEVVSVPNWDVQVIETMRGDAAWQSIQAANQFNGPAPQGMEYLLVKIHVKSTYTDSEEHSIGGGDFKVTGDRLIEYSGGLVVEPDPKLDARIFSGGEAEGWTAHIIGQGEGNLILLVNELLDFSDEGLRFIALDDGAAIGISPDLVNIQPTDLGNDRNNPAPRTEKIITEDWEVSVREVIRGGEALRMAQEANQFNQPPDEGMEYIAVKIHVRNISTEDKATEIGNSYFKTTGDVGVAYDPPSVVDPDPALDVSLFPGGEYEGWVVLQAANGETGVRLIFEPLFDFSSKNKRFISLD